ncbi:phosphatidate cytidylyltransferase [Blastopirellula marina]|uniref:phosphatidate cytidylyltransferase n=1 Tax=Blastopirellula marina TaxID=124 RepID=UPI0013048ECC|nr:phosphatidate cytidylyltransferase [Blastopirellula marina]
MLKWRLIGAFAIILPLCGLSWLDFYYNFGRPGIWLFPLVLLLTALSAEEVLDLLRAKQLHPSGWSCHVGTFLVVIAAGLPIWWPFSHVPDQADQAQWTLFALVLGAILAIVGEMRRYEKPGHSMIHLGLTIFAIFYVGGLLSFFPRLRVVMQGTPDANAYGMLALLSMIVVVKISDVGAYFIGSNFGRTKLVPRLSPGKTLEGTLGGLAASCLGSYVMFQWVGPWMLGKPVESIPLGWLLFALLVSPAGMVGDLAESMFKRDMETKDSSTWLIGLGGILDVLDSMLLGAPVALMCWELGIVGPGR